MIKKIVKKYNIHEQPKGCAYWLSKEPWQRVEAVELLRRQCYGSAPRLQRVVKVVQRS